jgi:hypothetical protein
MVILTWLLPQYKKEDRPSEFAYLFRQWCVVLATVDLVYFIYMSTNWEKYGVYIAVCEWIATLLIFFYNWSFAGDMTNYTLEEIENETPERPRSDHETVEAGIGHAGNNLRYLEMPH